MRRRYRIISKTRFFLFIITMSIIGTMLIMSLLSINEVYGSNYGYTVYDYNEIKIVSGDTLWMIALNHIPKEYDVRKMIYEIKLLNKMETSNIYPGDIIRIPTIR